MDDTNRQTDRHPDFKASVTYYTVRHNYRIPEL